MKIKHSVFSLQKRYGRTFFFKIFMGGGGVTWGLISEHARREEKLHKCIF